MKVTYLGIAALAAGGLAFTPNVRASDTMLLAGVGSLTGNRDITAPVITLKGDASTDADTIEVHGAVARGGVGFARAGGRAGVGVGRVGVGRVGVGVSRVGVGAARFAAGYPFYRSWGGFRPWGWYRPWYGFYRPWSWYGRAFYPGFGLNFGFGGYPYVGGYAAAYPSTVVYSSPAICSCPQYSAPIPQATETAPPPRPNDGYRYDGGPARPVPQPRPITPQTPPIPPAAVDTVARRSVKKLEYPAYGETSGTSRPSQDPLLVKIDRSK